MKIVVTGGVGKIGQWVVKELADHAHQVTILDRVPGPASGPFQSGPVRYLIGDVLDLGQVMSALAGADVVVHMAAYPAPRFVTDDVTFRTNVLGQFNVHEAAWRLGIRRVVSTSSSAAMGWVYRERDFLPQYLPLDEDHPLAPQDPYGLSKQVSEDIARSYANRSNLETLMFRPPGVVAPEQLEEMRASGGRRPARFSFCDYIDVRDLATAFRLAVEKPLTGWNVAFVAADDSNVSEPLATLLPQLLPEIGDMAKDLTGTQSGVSNAHAKALLGWQPQYSWRGAAQQA